MSDRPIPLTLSPEEQWTLHHVLLHRIEEGAAEGGGSGADPPPMPVLRAFETIDRGDLRFSVAELGAVRNVLAEYHHSTMWEVERPEIERLLDRITTALDERRSARVRS